MNETQAIIDLVKWAFGGFWRWLGFFFLVTAVSGIAFRLIGAVFGPLWGMIAPKSKTQP